MGPRVLINGIWYKEVRALLDTSSEMFDETGCVPGIDGEEVRAETMVPDAKEYISESIDNPEVLCDLETWDRPGFTLVLSWLGQKWLLKCHKLARPCAVNARPSGLPSRSPSRHASRSAAVPPPAGRSSSRAIVEDLWSVRDA